MKELFNEYGQLLLAVLYVVSIALFSFHNYDFAM